MSTYKRLEIRLQNRGWPPQLSSNTIFQHCPDSLVADTQQNPHRNFLANYIHKWFSYTPGSSQGQKPQHHQWRRLVRYINSGLRDPRTREVRGPMGTQLFVYLYIPVLDSQKCVVFHGQSNSLHPFWVGLHNESRRLADKTYIASYYTISHCTYSHCDFFIIVKYNVLLT